MSVSTPSDSRHCRLLALLLAILMVVLTGCGRIPGLLFNDPNENGDTPGYSLPAQLPKREVVIYYTGSEGSIPGSESVLTTQAANISTVVGFWFQLDPETYTDLRISANTSEAEIRRVVELAHARHIRVEMLVYSFLYEKAATAKTVISKLLADPGLTARLAENLVRQVKSYGFDGVNIDMEYVPPGSREAFTQFVRIIAERLRLEGIRLSISVPAKTWDDPTNGWAGGYDYAALGALVDRMMLMTYDEHGYSSATAGPIASIGWVRRVVGYAVSQVPAHKLLLGIPAYGFNWTSAQQHPIYLDYRAAVAPVSRGEVQLQRDEESGVPYYVYTDRAGQAHQVWFEDAESGAHKLDLMFAYGLRGFALWRAGMEDAGFWQAVKVKISAER